MVKRIYFLISGRVQGVGFRFFALQKAETLRLSGWVRNRSDESVEGEVEGESGKVAEFLAEIKEGPDHAEVRSLKVEARPPSGKDSPFEIRHG